jgi:hypothetical protein
MLDCEGKAKMAVLRLRQKMEKQSPEAQRRAGLLGDLSGLPVWLDKKHRKFLTRL